MTESDDLWVKWLEDEPCGSCGIRPSCSMGHGSFSCKPCYDSWWCPICHHMLNENHCCTQWDDPGEAPDADDEPNTLWELNEEHENMEWREKHAT